MTLTAAFAFGCAAFLLVWDLARAKERWHFGQNRQGTQVPPVKLILAFYDKLKSRFLGTKDDVSLYEDVCYSLAFHLRAGETSAQALKHVSQEAEEGAYGLLKRVFAAYEAGSPFLDALSSASPNNPYMQSITGVFQLGAASGADTPSLLCNTADLLRKKRLKKREAKAKIVESRLTAVILTVMPWVIGMYTLRHTPNSSFLLLGDPVIKTVLSLALLLWVVGVTAVWWLIGTATPRT